MKKVFLWILCLLFSSSVFFQHTEAFHGGNHSHDNQYSQFDLLENYLENHRAKIISFQNKYQIKNNTQLNNLLKEIESLTKISKKLKDSSVKWFNNEEVGKQIVERIKSINTELKELLTKEKNKYEENLKRKKAIYSDLWIKAGNHLITIIENLANKVTQSDIAIEKKMKIVVHLKNLQKNSRELRDFGKKTFSNEIEMQKNFINILREIREDMKHIKDILKK